MKIIWMNYWFLDYRIPVYKALSQIEGVELVVIYNKENIPEGTQKKLQNIEGMKAIAMENEKKLILGNKNRSGDFANKYISIPYQPGLYKEIFDNKPDVVISEGFFRWSIYNLIHKIRTKTPFVMLYERTEHTERNVNTITKFLRKLVLNFIDVICVNGKLTKQYIKSLGYSEKNITTKHMVADIHDISNRVKDVNAEKRKIIKKRVDASGVIFLFIGQLMPRKGLKELIDAWLNTIINKGLDATLLILGDGVKKNEYSKQAENVESIKFLGKIDYDDIHEYLSISDVMIMPTLEDNWSLVVPESMAAKLPIATTIYNGCYPELVKKQNGWVFDPLNQEEFEKVLLEIIKNEENLARMGEASWQIIKDHSPEEAAKSIYNSCNKAIES